MTEPTSAAIQTAPSPPLPLAGSGTLLGPAPLAERGWQSLALIVAALVVMFLAPFLTDNTYRLGICAECLALAILALGVDLIWGYTGLLSLGQGLYFCMGAYAMAYSLTLQYAAAAAGTPDKAAPPAFMSYTGLAPTHPDYVVPPALAYMAPLMNIWVAIAVALLLPMLFAAVFGGIAFRLRIGGVYFSLVTQALVLAFFILVNNQQPLTGGVVGINDIADLKLFGITFQSKTSLYFLIATVLAVCLIALLLLVRSKVGKLLTAIRDNENRVLALGYNTALYKTFAFTLAAGLAGLAGALFVPVREKMGPTFLDVPFSIEIVIFVAIGGRGSLTGAIVGTILVRMAYTDLAVAYPQWWPIILGALFVGVVLFLPRGLIVLAGRGALFGALLGLALLQPFDQFLKENLPGNDLFSDGDKLARPLKLVSVFLFLIGMVFVPKLIGLLYRRITGQRPAAPLPALAGLSSGAAQGGSESVMPAVAPVENRSVEETRIQG